MCQKGKASQNKCEEYIEYKIPQDGAKGVPGCSGPCCEGDYARSDAPLKDGLWERDGVAKV